LSFNYLQVFTYKLVTPIHFIYIYLLYNKILKFYFVIVAVPGNRYKEFVSWFSSIELQPIAARTYSDHLGIGVIRNMQAVYDCKQQSTAEDKARKDAFKARVDGDFEESSFDSRLNEHPNDIDADENDHEWNSHIVPLNIPDEDVTFAFDSFSGTGEFSDSELSFPGAATSSINSKLPITFNAPRGYSSTVIIPS